MNPKLLFILVALIGIAAGMLGYLAAPGPVKTSDFQAPAITDDGIGVMVPFRITLSPGNGRTLVNIDNANYHRDTEDALVKAKQNAEKLTGIKFRYFDVVLDIGASGSDIGGESAGAMFAIGIISAYTGKQVNPLVSMSGGITATGNLFPVDGIEEKIIAAKNSGKIKFVVAKEQVVKNTMDSSEMEIIRVTNIKEASDILLN